MTRVAWAPIAVEPETLVILDATRRLYAGLSRDSSYYHVVQPTQFPLIDLESGEVLRPAGTLACTCRGFTSHGHCYQATAAIAFEGELADQAAMPTMFREPVMGLDNPAGAGEMVEAARG